MTTPTEIRGRTEVEIGTVPTPRDLEYPEYLQYEDGSADRAAAAIPGPHAEPWQNVIATYEPGSQPQLEQLLAHPRLGPRVRGRVLDLGAGTCWATARLSRVPAVEEVTAVDLAPSFLAGTGNRMLEVCGAERAKVRLLASTFERVPRPDETFDTMFLIAAIHHALAPIRVLREAFRMLKPTGTLFVFETPAAPWAIRERRNQGIAISRETRMTEIAYTRGEFEYLFRCGGFVIDEAVPSEDLSPRVPQRWARSALRALGLERRLMTVGYIFALRRDPALAR
ncbi:MAG TPA: class I SAM-dependent methyltransferase [Thermoanaerobaculia bacterium]|nr:class I SAM-dependent methyltransferase [Thermoanaerobaculia bacterium]